ncbi:sugar O-acyltransferase (sialic acid O-acetyltransferase NeuD family) [Tenacibaculum skagerrakense]|uniref:Sugar O-acyltransferase (Sialic acid O-acetyltransferase NeuD family) n=1 Tax=Tenacibaculum skagerrakense TaxID=186571 RepID=A0A4R2NN07_9FLAO|nr:NeuD/PglB/VioB family sugar acetyltransferase [Tenacibaculum skagerrakense]TCP22912.1 sugar O-acyltransferase (sialic acid O-acetyltransferase NeuD family) [Tenacibaculum skagerrakense]
MEKPELILIGGGGHCISVIDVVESEKKYFIKGILDAYTDQKDVLGYPVLGGDDLIDKYVNKKTFFLITVGQIKSYEVRKKISKKILASNAQLATVISPRAYVSKHSSVGKGTIIMHDAIIGAGASIGDNCIINTKANIEHGVCIGDYCHISTCAVVNGDSKVEFGTFVGSNATVSNGIIIKQNSIISAGEFIKG